MIRQRSDEFSGFPTIFGALPKIYWLLYIDLSAVALSREGIRGVTAILRGRTITMHLVMAGAQFSKG